MGDVPAWLVVSDGVETDSRLKTCPFCGCLAWVETGRPFSPPDTSRGWRVECRGMCHGMTCWWHTEVDAIANWNNRASEEASDA